jgi:hypothetical protein
VILETGRGALGSRGESACSKFAHVIGTVRRYLRPTRTLPVRRRGSRRCCAKRWPCGSLRELSANGDDASPARRSGALCARSTGWSLTGCGARRCARTAVWPSSPSIWGSGSWEQSGPRVTRSQEGGNHDFRFHSHSISHQPSKYRPNRLAALVNIGTAQPLKIPPFSSIFSKSIRERCPPEVFKP